MKRLGVVLIFKKGAQKEDILHRLAQLAKPVRGLMAVAADGRSTTARDIPAVLDEDEVPQDLHEFDDHDGTWGPVWYIP